MTSKPLVDLDRLMPSPDFSSEDREFVRTAVPIVGFIAVSTATLVVVLAREISGAVRHPSSTVRFLLTASLFADAGIIGYGIGKSTEARKHETEEERLARVGQVKPVDWKTYAKPARGAVMIALATSRTKSVPASVRSGVVNYLVVLGLGYAARRVAPRLSRVSVLGTKLKERRAGKPSLSAEEQIKLAVSRLEGVAGAGSGTAAPTPEELERWMEEAVASGKAVVVEPQQEGPDAWAIGEDLARSAEAVGKSEERVNVLGSDVPRHKFTSSLQWRLDEQEAARKDGPDSIIDDMLP